MSRNQRLLLVCAALAALLSAAAGLAGDQEAIAFLGPILVLLLPLFAGRYLGEDRIARAAARRRRRTGEIAFRLPMPPAAPWAESFVSRGGRLIADALAKRPPPVVVLT